MRKLLLFVVVLLVLAGVGDLWLRSFASDRASDTLEDALPLSGQLRVEIEDFPFLLAALRGEFEAVALHSSRVETDGGVELRDVEIHLVDVTVSPLRAAAGRPTELGWRRGSGTADIPLEALVPAELAGAAEGEVAVADNTLALGDARVALPTPLPGMRYRRAVVRNGTVEAGFSVRRSRIPLP